MRIPTVTLKHKRKNKLITVNESDWAQDLGVYKYRDYERVNERHNEGAAPLEVFSPTSPLETSDSVASVMAPRDPEPAPARRGPGRPRKVRV